MRCPKGCVGRCVAVVVVVVCFAELLISTSRVLLSTERRLESRLPSQGQFQSRKCTYEARHLCNRSVVKKRPRRLEKICRTLSKLQSGQYECHALSKMNIEHLATVKFITETCKKTGHAAIRTGAHVSTEQQSLRFI